MANKVLLKKSSVVAKVPLVGDLDHGELALNFADEKLYFKNSSNVIKSISSVDTTSFITLNDTQTLTNKTIAAGSNTITGLTNSNLSGTAGITNANLANSSVTIGSTTVALGATVTTFTGLASVTSTAFVGALTGNAATATTLQTARTIALTGDVTYTSGAFNGSANVTGTATLANSGVVAGSYGGSTSIPVLTIDAKGRVTAASTTSITVGDGTLTLSTSGIATGSQTFTANQATAATFTVNVPGTNIAEGTRTTTTVPITSSTGSNATLSAASTTLAGVMTSADKTKLDGIAAGAQVNVATNLTYSTATTTGTVNSSTGTNATIPAATTTLAGLMTNADKTKLDGIAAGATTNTGTVTSVSGTGTASGLTLSGTVTTSGSLSLSGTVNSLAAGTYGISITGNAATATTALQVIRTVAGTGSVELVRGNMGDNDQARILVGATASNAGFLEIATADDGTEPIHVRQYTGVFTTLARTATLLDGSGNTSFPGTVTAPAFTGALSGNASTATTLQTARTLTVGNTGKTFNGSANVAWTLAEIGAYAATNPSGFTSNTGTVTSIGVTPGTGISVSGSPVTTSGNITVTNTAPNVTTNITTTHNASTVVVNSSDGTNGTINAATTTLAGVMTGVDKTKLDGIAAGAQVNVATNLGITAGTTAGPIVTSSTGTNATLPTASATASGVVTTANQTWAGVKTFSSTITGSISGNAASATVLQTARTINGVSFNGSANITVADATKLPLAGGSLTGTLTLTGNATSIRQNTTASWSGDAPNGVGKLEYHSNRWYINAGADSTMVVQFRRGGSDVANINNSGVYSGSIAGNAATATTLQTTRAINGVNFNGSAAITVPGNFANRTTNESGHISFIGTTATGNQAQFTNTNIRVNPATATVTSETGAFAAPFLLNKASISTSYSIPSGFNAVAAGPVVIANGITVTIPTGSTWVIV